MVEAVSSAPAASAGTMSRMSDDETNRLLEFYRDRVDSYPGVDPAFGRAWRDLCRQVLTHGGRLVVPPLEPEHDLAGLLAGRLWDVPALRRRRERNACHSNSAALWARGKATSIGTGYALTDDGLWRQHSWAFTGTGHRRRILETTEARDAYYGIELTGAAAVAFAAANV